MFENLSERLGGVFDRLTKQGALSDEDVATALREVRVALLEADVSLPVARDFVKAVQEKATGQAVTKSITPGQQVVKIVHDELVAMLGGDPDDPQSALTGEGLKLDAKPPVVVMMVGLQGSGKTTTTAKLGKLIREKHGKKAMMASLDVNRPAAQEQLKVLGEQVDVATLPIVAGQQPVDIARRAMEASRLQNFDVLLLDTAGRLHVDEALMAEMKAVSSVSAPTEVLLVVDSLTGQDAVNVAQSFSGEVPLTGVVLTRMDGDARGGAALSMRAVTGKPIKFAGTGEKLDQIEPFRPGSVADRILGMGDVVSLVEKAQETLEVEQAERMMKRFQKGQFNMNDLRGQLEQMLKMGGMDGIMGMMPGMAKMQKQVADAGFDDKILRQQIALINSMTKKERANPGLLQASRKKRIAKGAGQEVSELNKLLKMHRQMSDMMKRMGKMGKGGMLKQAMKGMFGKGGGMPEGGMPDMNDPKAMAEAAKALQGKMPGGLPGLGGGGMQLPPGLSGFGKKK